MKIIALQISNYSSLIRYLLARALLSCMHPIFASHLFTCTNTHTHTHIFHAFLKFICCSVVRFNSHYIADILYRQFYSYVNLFATRMHYMQMICVLSCTSICNVRRRYITREHGKDRYIVQ